MPTGVKLAYLLSCSTAVLVVMIITINKFNFDQKKVSKIHNVEITASDPLFISGIGRSGYVLVVHYWEQVTCASRNLQNLQCWAARNRMTVVEPFIKGSYLGVSDPEKKFLLRFSDIYDMNNWTLASNHTLASWSEFMKKAPRNLIHVGIRYGDAAEENCDLGLPDIFRRKGFTLVREACIHSNRNFTVKEFNKEIFGEHNSPSTSTVLLNTWRGMGKL